MMDQDKSKQQPSDELTELRQRVATLEAMEEELRKSRTLLQATIDNLPFDFFAIGMDGRYMLQNATSKAHWGDAVGKRSEDVAGSEETLVLCKENNRRAFAGEKVEEDVTLIIDDEKRHYHNVIAPIIDAGRIQGILGVNIDITERKRAEEVLRHSESRFRSLFQESPVGAVVVTPNGQFLQVNRAFCDFLGYSKPELVGQTVLSITHPEDREASSTAIRQAAESVAPLQRLEKRYLHKSGQVVWGEVSSTLMHDAEDKPDCFITQVLDITERKRAEERLRNSERTLRTLIDASPESILLMDTDGTILIANETVARRLGTTVDEITGQRIRSFMPPEVAANRNEHVAEVVRTGKPIRYEDQRSGRHFENTMHPVLDEQGKVAAVAILAIDRTDRKRAEQALKQAHDELERRVEERTAELSEANHQLQREVEERRAVEETLLHSRDELQTIYDEMVEGCLITDIETKRFLRVNSSFCRMVGYSEEELLAALISDIHPSDEVTNDLQRFQQVAEGQRSLNENRPILRKNGTIFYADIAGRRIFYHGRPSVLALFRDVTERRQAQVALQESEEKYKTLVETLPDAVIMADLTGHATFVSRQFVELHVAESADEFLGRCALDYMVPEDHEKCRIYYHRTLEDGITRDVEYSLLKKDGTRFPGELSSALVNDASGKPVAIVSVLRDISERKRAEEALRQSRDQLKAVYDGMSDGLLVADIETKRFVRANASICRMLGYSKEELLTLSVRDIHPEADLPFVVEQFQALVLGKIRVSEDVPVLRKDGTIFHAAVSSSLVDYDNRHCVAGFFRDSTERKHAEDALRKSEERFRSYFEQGLMGMAVSKGGTQWTEVNDRFCDILGYSREEVSQRKRTDFIHPDDVEAARRDYARLLTGETDHYTADRRYIRKDGNVIFLAVFGRVFRSKEGTVDNVLGLFNDVTERTSNQRALRQSHDELQTIYDQAVDGIIIVDAKKTNPIRANTAYCRMVGYSEEDVYSLSPERVHPPEALPAVLRHLDTVNKGNVARIDNMPFLRKDGCIAYADVVSSPIIYNERPCLISFFHDVTERKHVQDAGPARTKGLFR